MRDAPVANIIRRTRVVGPDDSIGRASEALRAAGLPELPVVHSGRVLGLVTEVGILAAISGGAEASVRTVMTDKMVSVTSHATVGQAAEMMHDHGLAVLPVVGMGGEYLGFVTRSDVLGAFCLTIRPPSIGGLATPLGVYMTTGHIRAGAGDFGLFLTGVMLAGMRYAADGAVWGFAWLWQHFGKIPMLAVLQSPGVGTPNWMDYLAQGLHAASVLLFLLFMRLLPLSGYHAAEHQTITAIEEGEPLVPARVRRMPRVHMRCGTNLLAAVMVFIMVVDKFSADLAVLLGLFVVIFAWRSMGALLQQYATTKPASKKQLESGIAAGSELLEKYRKNPARQAAGFERFWNLGMLQVMLGMMAVFAGEELIRLFLR
ncbi:MAG: DUF1385 domain-containing protein [Armatimonadota bacterium]